MHKQYGREIRFETGALSRDEVKGLLDTLPFDITFVDKDDLVRYFSDREMIFSREKEDLNRTVQQCHSEKSRDMVNKILDDFRNGKKDVFEFWQDKDGRKVHVRYFAVRGKNGEYVGCLEVTQDITDIKKIEGEKKTL